MLHHNLVNLNVTIRRPYVPYLIFGPSAELNSVRYNTILDSTAYVKIMVTNTVLGYTWVQIVC